MHDSPKVAFAEEGGIARIALARPEHRNAIDLALAVDLCQAVEAASSAQVLVISGEGSDFCVGGDLRAFSAESDLPSLLRDVTSWLHRAILALVEGPPVIGMLRGAVAGAGLGLAGACDYVLAEDSTRFRFGYTAIGLSPDAGASYFLPRLMGERSAAEFCLSNRIMDAPEALQAGLVNQVVTPAEADGALGAWLERFVEGIPPAITSSLSLFRRTVVNDLREHLRAEEDHLCRNAGAPEAKEAIERFLVLRGHRSK